MEIKRILTNLCSTNLGQSKTFYTSIFDFDVAFESDWFVQLKSKAGDLELGLIEQTHQIVPKQAQGDVSGMYLTFVVDDVDVTHQLVCQLGYEVIQVPEMTFYGQKRMLLMAPEGTVCDISSPTEG